MSPLKTTLSLRSALVLSRRTALALVCTACADDITCVDLANCVYPEADAGPSNAGASDTNASNPTATSDDGQGDRSTASHASAPSSPSATSSDGADDTTSSSSCLEADACECEEGTSEPCWESPDGTPITDNPEDAIGDCKLGKRTCEGGAWGACIGAVAPQETDSCDRPLADDNCNGVVNEDCDCTPTDTRSCGTDEGPCVAGVQTCQEDGTWEPVCIGEVAPANEETCAIANTDANCNGEKNEGCECIGTEVEPCNDCGERTCNPNTGRWGACQPVEASRCADDATGIQVCNSLGNWQTQECTNDDETHCDVRCSHTSGEPQCEVTAKDADNDGYRAAACVNAVNPGTDCDDSLDTVSPGSSEICDGVDNDCDGKVDLSDGLSLIGNINIIANRDRVAVTSTKDGFFVLVGTSPIDDGLFYGSINASGAAQFATTPSFIPTLDEVYLDPQIAWSSGLGVMYSTNGKGGKFANVAITWNGSTWQDLPVPAEGTVNYPHHGDITARSNGDLLMVGVRPTGNTIFLSTHNEFGNAPLANSTEITGSLSSYVPHLASNGDNSGLLWQTISPTTLSWSLISATLEFGPVEVLSTSAFYADVSAIDAGYGLAWIEGAGFRFMIKNSEGVTECTSSVIPFGTVAANQELAIAESAHGVVVVATSPDSNAVHLYRFDGACDVVDDIAVSTSASAPRAPSVARGGSNLVIYWTEGSTGRYRFVSDMLCH